jgi:hypothetical protein
VAGIDIYVNDKKFSGVNTTTGVIPVTDTIHGRFLTFIVRGVLTTDAKNSTKYTPTLTVYVNK